MLMKKYVLPLLLTMAGSVLASVLTTPGYGRRTQPLPKPSFRPPTVAPSTGPLRREHHRSGCHFDADKPIDLYLTLPPNRAFPR